MFKSSSFYIDRDFWRFGKDVQPQKWNLCRLTCCFFRSAEELKGFYLMNESGEISHFRDLNSCPAVCSSVRSLLQALTLIPIIPDQDALRTDLFQRLVWLPTIPLRVKGRWCCCHLRRRLSHLGHAFAVRCLRRCRVKSSCARGKAWLTIDFGSQPCKQHLC